MFNRKRLIGIGLVGILLTSQSNAQEIEIEKDVFKNISEEIVFANQTYVNKARLDIFDREHYKQDLAKCGINIDDVNFYWMSTLFGDETKYASIHYAIPNNQAKDSSGIICIHTHKKGSHYPIMDIIVVKEGSAQILKSDINPDFSLSLLQKLKDNIKLYTL